MPQKAPEPRTGMPSVELDVAEFMQRFKSQFTDPAFDAVGEELNRVAAVACAMSGQPR